jgi:predicted DNA-binding antitoxin AbrB/MazE fold protein
MALTIEATYENGVLVPDHPLTLRDHGRVVLTVQPLEEETPAAVDAIRRRRARRIQIDPELAEQIVRDPDPYH